MEIRFAAAAPFPFFHDVQPIRVSQFQGDQLENAEIDPAFSCDQSASYSHGDVLPMDAGRSLPQLPALRFSPAVALARMAPRNRRRNRRRRLRRSDRTAFVKSTLSSRAERGISHRLVDHAISFVCSKLRL